MSLGSQVSDDLLGEWNLKQADRGSIENGVSQIRFDPKQIVSFDGEVCGYQISPPYLIVYELDEGGAQFPTAMYFEGQGDLFRLVTDVGTFVYQR